MVATSLVGAAPDASLGLYPTEALVTAHVVAGEAGGGAVVFLVPVAGGGLRWACGKCSFVRVYATKQGAINAVVEHMARHGVRAEFR